MIIDYYDPSLVKQKFAMLLSKLHSAYFLTEYINHVIVKSPFFDCFEKNELKEFMTTSFETITERIFRKEVVFDYDFELSDPFYWAGLSYMDIMMNARIPLKRIMIILPLNEMVSLFNPYHEMHQNKIIEYYLEKERNTSLLKRIRKEKEVMLSKTSDLLEINIASLRKYETSNESLFQANINVISKLANFFNVSIDVFKKESSYIPFSELIVKSEKVRPYIVESMLNYFQVDNNKTYCVIQDEVNEKELRILLEKYSLIITLANPYGIIQYVNSRLTYKYLEDLSFLYLYNSAISKLRKQENILIF